MEMDKKQIIDLCSEWAENDEKRVAVVILAEPAEEGKITSLQFFYGNRAQMANILGSELNDNKDFADIVKTAATVAIAIRMQQLSKEKREEKK